MYLHIYRYSLISNKNCFAIEKNVMEYDLSKIRMLKMNKSYLTTYVLSKNWRIL